MLGTASARSVEYLDQDDLTSPKRRWKQERRDVTPLVNVHQEMGSCAHLQTMARTLPWETNTYYTLPSTVPDFAGLRRMLPTPTSSRSVDTLARNLPVLSQLQCSAPRPIRVHLRPVLAAAACSTLWTRSRRTTSSPSGRNCRPATRKLDEVTKLQARAAWGRNSQQLQHAGPDASCSMMQMQQISTR